MYDRSDSLFARVSALEVARRLPSEALEKLKKFDENTILSVPKEDLVNQLMAAHEIHIPELQTDDAWIEEQELSREVERRGYDIFSDQAFGRHIVKTHIVTFHLPFSGDGDVFNIAPSSRSIPGPSATVKMQELLIVVPTNGRNADQVKADYTNTVHSIEEHLGRLKRDLGHVVQQIQAPALEYLEKRKTELLKAKNLVSSLGFPMKRRAEVPQTFRAPEVRRRLTPIKQEVVSPFQPESALPEAEYIHILGVMENMTKVMERSPRTFHDMGEEDIRQHFLVQLNGHYEGQASGETFNYQVKTDILIRSEGRNIFIAECKFWHGGKAFVETIDQLLSYLSWRDSKSAVVVFNKNKNLSAVLTTIKEAMEKHPHKKRGPTVEGETRFRYTMGHPGDHTREIFMTIMVFDIPSPG